MALTVRTLSAQTVVQYDYDALGRLIAVVDPTGDTATYTYDAVGNVLSISRHGSSQVSIITFLPRERTRIVNVILRPMNEMT